MSKEKRKRNPLIPNNLSLYTLHLPPSNHSSYSDVPSEYPTMISHTTNTTLITTTMPQHPMSQHLSPLPYHNKLYRHHLLTSSCHLSIYHHFRFSITPIPSPHPIPFLSTLDHITRNPSPDSIPLLRSRSSGNTSQWSRPPWGYIDEIPPLLVSRPRT